MVLQVNPMMMGVKKSLAATGFLTVGSGGIIVAGYQRSRVGDFVGSLAGFPDTDVLAIADIGASVFFIEISGGPFSNLSLTIDGVNAVMPSFFDGEYGSFSGDPYNLASKIGQTLPVFGEFI